MKQYEPSFSPAETTTVITATSAGSSVAERNVRQSTTGADFKEKVEHIAEEAKEKADDAAENVQEKASDVAGEVKEKAGDIVSGIKEKVADMREDFEEYQQEKQEEAEREIAEKAADPVYNLNIEGAVVEKITSLAAQKIDGIIAMKGNMLSMIQEGFGGSDDKKGVSATKLDDDYVQVDLDVIIEYGKSATEVFEDLKEVVSDDVKTMTGLDVVEMNVHIVDVMSREEFEKKQNSGLSGFANLFAGDDDTDVRDGSASARRAA